MKVLNKWQNGTQTYDPLPSTTDDPVGDAFVWDHLLDKEFQDDLYDLPEWLLADDPSFQKTDHTPAAEINSTGIINEEKTLLSNDLNDTCFKSILLARLSNTQWRTLHTKINKTLIQKFCDISGISLSLNTTSKFDLVQRQIIAEVEAMCNTMPLEALPLFNLTNITMNGIDAPQLCQNMSLWDSLSHWIVGYKKVGDFDLSLGCHLTCCLHTSLLLFLVTRVISYFG